MHRQWVTLERRTRPWLHTHTGLAACYNDRLPHERAVTADYDHRECAQGMALVLQKLGARLEWHYGLPRQSSRCQEGVNVKNQLRQRPPAAVSRASRG